LTDAELAKAIAIEAGALLLRIQADCAGGARGDREANALILERLRAERPEDAVLSEESADDLSRLDRSRVWVIDPLDGTREFAERRDDWAVHVALAIDGRAALGAVALPRLGVTLSSSAPPPLPPLRSPPRLLVSRTRPSRLCADVAERIGAEPLGMGSAGAKAMAVVRGEAEIYLHTGGQHQWDNCAPVAVALAAGLHASRIDGSAILYNRRETSIPDLLICRTEWAEQVLSTVRDCVR
jgi:3'(2'), 5'-bisphosphate nucleotidase